MNVTKSRMMKWSGHVASMGEGEKCVQGLEGGVKETDHPKDVGIDGRKLQLMWMKYDYIWIVFISLRTKACGGLWWTWVLRFHKLRGISWLGEKLSAFQEGLCSMKLVTQSASQISNSGNTNDSVTPKLKKKILTTAYVRSESLGISSPLCMDKREIHSTYSHKQLYRHMGNRFRLFISHNQTKNVQFKNCKKAYKHTVTFLVWWWLINSGNRTQLFLTVGIVYCLCKFSRSSDQDDRQSAQSQQSCLAGLSQIYSLSPLIPKGSKLFYSLGEAIKQSLWTTAYALSLYLDYNPLILFRNTPQRLPCRNHCWCCLQSVISFELLNLAPFCAWQIPKTLQNRITWSWDYGIIWEIMYL